MRFNVRFLLSVLAALAALTVLCAPAASGAVVKKFFAANCNEAHPECGEGAEGPGDVTEAANQGFRKAGADVPYGVTDFVLNTVPIGGGNVAPPDSVKYLRTDVAPGVVTDPEAASVSKCSIKAFDGPSDPTLEKEGLHQEPECPESSIIGVNYVETALPNPFTSKTEDVKVKGLVYNLEQPYGLASDFGVALSFSSFENAKGEKFSFGPVVADSFIEGNVEWASDYHDYFEIKNITPGLISSRLTFFGTEEEVLGHEVSNYGFLRNPSECSEEGPATTTTLTVETEGGTRESVPYTDKVGTDECEQSFLPTFALQTETAASDAADGITTEVSLPHPKEATETDSANLKTATITLPEGLTMNPSAAAGLEGCTPEQIGIGTRNPTRCPAHSQIGTVTLEVPTLPAGSLQGALYLGKPAGRPIEGPPYTIYIDAESARYGVKVRLEGTVEPNPVTGRLTTTFVKNPEQPFDSIALHFSGGAFAPLANPLTCGAGSAVAFTPFSKSAAVSAELPFALEGCAALKPALAPVQSTTTAPAGGAASTNFSFALTRPEGQQYLETVKTVLPAGLAGKIPTVTQCPEAEANAGTCAAESLLGSVTVLAGSGEPYPFHGNVYLTGPYDGAPFGLSFVVPVVAGPFSLGTEVKRAKIEVEPYTSRVIVTTTLPTIRDGIPTRIRAIDVDITRPNFMVNPTSCAGEQAESLVRSTFGNEATVTSPFQAQNCSSLPFNPSFSASTSGKPDKADGASLVTTITQGAGQANIKSVLVTLPYQLPSRDSTLKKACLAATFEHNPEECPKGSRVGGASAVTPLLPGKLKGTAYYISHGGEKFPDLDVVLEGDGVRTILIGNTHITHGVTTTDFADNPDVPISSFTLNLPMGPYSALAAPEGLCVPKLVMPTVITAQNGKQVKKNTVIKPAGCGVQIVGHKVAGATAYLTIKTFEAGRISGSGPGLATVYRTLGSAEGATTLKVPLSGSGRARGPFRTRLRVGFRPRRRGARSSQAYVTVSFG